MAHSPAPSLVWCPHAPADAAHALATIAAEPDTHDAFACPLTWLAGDWRVESWQTQAPVACSTVRGWQVRRTPQLAFVARHISAEASGDNRALEHAVRQAYRSLAALRQDLALAHVQRIWHWLYAILDGRGEDQRYRVMCRGRAEGLKAWPDDTVLPPATGVGRVRPGVRLQALFGNDAVRPIENPRQISAYRYPPEHGRKAPQFARAAVCRLADTPYLLVSGTASIVGHRTRHPGDVRRQTEESLTNVAAVMDAARPAIGARRADELAGIRAYVRRPEHARVVATLLRQAAPGVPIALLHADLCRADLEVELETLLQV